MAATRTTGPSAARSFFGPRCCCPVPGVLAAIHRADRGKVLSGLDELIGPRLGDSQEMPVRCCSAGAIAGEHLAGDDAVAGAAAPDREWLADSEEGGSVVGGHSRRGGIRAGCAWLGADRDVPCGMLRLVWRRTLGRLVPGGEVSAFNACLGSLHREWPPMREPVCTHYAGKKQHSYRNS